VFIDVFIDVMVFKDMVDVIDIIEEVEEYYPDLIHSPFDLVAESDDKDEDVTGFIEKGQVVENGAVYIGDVDTDVVGLVTRSTK
jgi:hypothetical protein